MSRRYQTVLLFGAPGVGKGTQGRLLGQIPGFVHMASGDMFRSLDRRSDLGRQFLLYSSQGLLVPDGVTIEVWEEYVNRQIEAGRFRPDLDLLILDGIPRNVAQSEALQPHIEVLLVVHLKPPDVESMVERLRKRAIKEGRHDDADEGVIRRRFEVYEEETAPVLGCYGRKLVSEVGAGGTPAEVLLGVLKAIVPVYRKRFGNPLDASPAEAPAAEPARLRKRSRS